MFMDKDIKTVSIIGAGSWGTTLALLLAEKGLPVCLWEKFPDYCRVLQDKRENITFLPGKHLPERIRITDDLNEALHYAYLVVMAVPSHVLRPLLADMKPFVHHTHSFVSVIKGIEQETLAYPSGIVHDMLGAVSFAALSGPTHAEEVAEHMPSAIVAASHDPELSGLVQSVFATPYFRVYTNTDIVGVQLAGALKNVIAIAAGISDGLGFGDNTKAALLTRGLTEMARLGEKMGAKKDTFYGLSGMGDLITTCASVHSRNRHVGVSLGKGETLDAIRQRMTMVAEGVRTAKSTYHLAQMHGVEMPIVQAMYAVLFQHKKPQDAVTELMARDWTSE